MQVRATPRGGTRACAVWRSALDRAEASPPVAAASSLDPDHQASARGRSFQAPPLTRERTRRAAFPDRPGSYPLPWPYPSNQTQGPEPTPDGVQVGLSATSSGSRGNSRTALVGGSQFCQSGRSGSRVPRIMIARRSKLRRARLCPLCDLLARQLSPRRGDIPQVAAPRAIARPGASTRLPLVRLGRYYGAQRNW